MIEHVEKFAEKVSKPFGKSAWVIKGLIIFAGVIMLGGLIAMGAFMKRSK